MKFIKTLVLILAFAMLLSAMTACRNEAATASVPETETETEEVPVRGTIPPTKPALVVNGAKA